MFVKGPGTKDCCKETFINVTLCLQGNGSFFFTSAGCVNSCTVETLVEASRFYHRPKQGEKERESKPA